MKTIKQIADELGVSKQAVTYHLKKLEATKENGSLAVKENGVLVVSLVGEKLIKSAFLENDRQTFGDNQQPKDHQKDEPVLAVLKATIDTLQKQLEIKDKQIEKLQTENEKLIDTIKGAQALHAGTMQKEFLADNIKEPTDEPIIIKSVIEPKKEELRKGIFNKISNKFSRK